MNATHPCNLYDLAAAAQLQRENVKVSKFADCRTSFYD